MEKNFPINKKFRKYNLRYIYPSGDNYNIRKSVNGKFYVWGSYSSEKKAIIVRDYLEFLHWDLTYLPTNLVGSNKMPTDEYYLNILPFLAGDVEYEKYKKLGE